MKKILLLIVLSFLMITSCADNKHFISDAKYRKTVNKDFLNRKDLASNRSKELFSVMKDANVEEREALEFLYAYMPFSDLADYDGEFFLNQVKYAFKAKDFFHWGKDIPEDVFRHFVLVYRVNNENLDTARMVIFDELKDRIKDMSMYDAALEVNHWCHEKVTYRPSDGRTSAPLASIKTAFGRCGEESTFTVTAMRAVGIPARQCYTPRWAHTDDNHAWVEVWVDGKWYFLGACEPDAELNMGWFAIPATRTMMVHSNAYGKYVGNDEVTHKTNLFSRINMLDNYTDTKMITIKVTDENGAPVENAKVKFKLYNYAEYYPIASINTNSKGEASLTTGYGDLLIWASKDDKFNYQQFNVRENDKTTIALTRTEGQTYIEFFDMIPPEGLKEKKTVSEEKTALTNKRLQYEDSLRNAYLATFPKREQVNIDSENLSKAQIWQFIQKSEGNYAEIEKFIKNNSKKVDGLHLYEFLNALSEKDLRDVEANTIQQHITYYQSGKYDLDSYIKGILPARISNEMIRPWRGFLANEFKTIFKDKEVNSTEIINWINENIAIDNEGNYFNCPISPRGVFELKNSDKHSRDIFFIAICRSLDIPAYLDGATNQLWVFENEYWNVVAFEEEKTPKPSGRLILTYEDNGGIKPEYWIHYTIAKFENGDFVTFDYENDPRVENFPITLDLESGYYMLSTGNRYSDGTVLSKLEFINIPANRTAVREIDLRKLVPRDEFYGTIDMNFVINLPEGDILAKELTGDKNAVVCFIDPNREPTKHLFKDIIAYKEQFEKWGGAIIFAIPTEKRTADFKPENWNLPKQSQFFYDEESSWMNNILISTKQEFRDNYPLVYIITPEGKLIFKTEGYRIGTGELIFKSLE
ncbi:transglutaminase domain-containing protein [Bacteroidales bacterium OttesenSCG-928-K22]|nr:transglutaminase domain-containing protein [Bacteroidales bacterium OttesenSCG-928-L14]MDL2240599.1 transglutaminase domain-containing protein [Bacteroidales bacterium OttesenSCG-928-K22]